MEKEDARKQRYMPMSVNVPLYGSRQQINLYVTAEQKKIDPLNLRGRGSLLLCYEKYPERLPISRIVKNSYPLKIEVRYFLHLLDWNGHSRRVEE